MIKETTMCHNTHSSEKNLKTQIVALGVAGLKLTAIFILLIGLTACGSIWDFFTVGSNYSGKSYRIKGKRYHILASADGYQERGHASWYGEPFHGRKTANGETYDMNKISAAHKTLPLNTWVEVRNLDTNKVLAVRINDRGPFIRGRIIDLSREAAKEMDMLKTGVAKVSVRSISKSRARQLVHAQELASKQMLAASDNLAPSAGSHD